MTTPVFCSSSGSNTSPYETWAKAATSLATALAQASSDGDTVIIQYNAVPSGDAELAADTTYTFANNITLISASNDGGAAYTPTEMGTGNWIGNSTTNRFVTWAGADRRVRMWGMTLRISGTTLDDVRFGSTSSGINIWAQKCYLWNGNTGSGAAFQIGTGGYGMFRFIDCTWRFGGTGQTIQFHSSAEIIGGSISSAGSTPTTLISAGTAGVRNTVTWRGVDLSLITGTLVGNCEGRIDFIFDRCKLGSAVTVLASQTTNPTEDSAHVRVLDCASDDTHTFTGYYNALGSAISDTGIYLTASAAAQSWKIVTTANAKPSAPFCMPWVSVYNATLSAMTPRLEVLRDGSTTAYTDAELWAECLAKTTSGFTIATHSDDRCAIGGTPANQGAGAGTGSWTGEAGSAWSGELEMASLTPAEVGYISMRACFAAASATVYVDPVVNLT